MKLNEFELGAEDARNLNLRSESQRSDFLRSFVTPRGFKLDDFFSGKKFFVLGTKGTGKTALLQFIRIKSEAELNAITGFYYFQSGFRTSELEQFKAALLKDLSSGDVLFNDPKFRNEDEIPVFWRIFLLSETSKLLKRAGVIEGPVQDFYEAVETLKSAAKSKTVGKKYPALKRFKGKAALNPSIEVEGEIEAADMQDFESLIEDAENALDKVSLEKQPVFMFVDELEVYQSNDDTEELKMPAVASLVRAVRDFNERFFETDIRIIAAVRSEVVTEVSVVQGEVYRIATGRGIEIGWSNTELNGLHPLEKIIISHLAAQDPEISGEDVDLTAAMLDTALTKYFPSKASLRNVLNLTWYRPRDMALVFEIAQSMDGDFDCFRKQTLSFSVLKKLGERMLIDAKAGLGVKYKPYEIDAMDRVLRGGQNSYSRKEFQLRIDDLADQYDDVALLSDNRWTEVVNDLYKVGILCVENTNSKFIHFHHRGDSIPSLTDDFLIKVNRSLVKTLSIS